MRWHLRRMIHVIFILVLPITLIIIYRSSSQSNPSSSASFEIIHWKNQTFRVLPRTYHYHVSKPYLNFAYYHVEQRDRVLHIDAQYDVPISAQWDSRGHFYPIQIAQFGLSHWSRWISPKKQSARAFDQINSLRTNQADSCSSWYTFEKAILLNETFIHFVIASHCSLYIHFHHANYTVIYTTEPTRMHDDSRALSIFLTHAPRLVNRYVLIDIEKAKKRSLFLTEDHLQVRICGRFNTTIDRLIIGDQTRYNELAFYAAGRWLLDHQDMSTGCWWIHIPRFFGDRRQHRLPMPWCSAMAQGQAASLFVRLYLQTQDSRYHLAFRRAIQPLWSSNITRAYFQNRFVWLEEYPLVKPAPGLFVLNGGLYALLGLIDVQSIESQTYLARLIDELRQSLHALLPLYIHPNDSHWSLYDLGHITLGSPVKIASFSYHLVHINLLQCFSSIFQSTETSSFLDEYVRRFRSFMHP